MTPFSWFFYKDMLQRDGLRATIAVLCSLAVGGAIVTFWIPRETTGEALQDAVERKQTNAKDLVREV